MIEYAIVVDDKAVFRSENLKVTIRTWDGLTHIKPRFGGITVQEWNGSGEMTRDGWLLHVQPNGSVYVNPNIGRA